MRAAEAVLDMEQNYQKPKSNFQLSIYNFQSILNVSICKIENCKLKILSYAPPHKKEKYRSARCHLWLILSCEANKLRDVARQEGYRAENRIQSHGRPEERR